MRTTQLLFFAAVITATLFTQQASATIWRVNNKSNYNGTTLYGDNYGGTQSYPVFTQIDQVVPLSSTGDTIYVEASSIAYANATNIDRKITIIGAGYFLDQNLHVSSTIITSLIGEIHFNSGSEGSQVIGMTNIDAGGAGAAFFYVNVSNITVKRCNLRRAIQIAPSLSDIYILENFFNSSGSSVALEANGGSGFNYPTDLVFNNNICQKTLVWGGSILQCNNNTFDGPANNLDLSFTTSEFKNNILKSLNATTNINNGSNLNVSYNIGTSATQFGTANNNIVVSSINTIFVTSTSPDGSYQLKPGSSPGSDGTDRGAFGGAPVTDRYTLSGLAAIPVIYSISTPGATATDLPVTIGAKTIK